MPGRVMGGIIGVTRRRSRGTRLYFSLPGWREGPPVGGFFFFRRGAPAQTLPATASRAASGALVLWSRHSIPEVPASLPSPRVPYRGSAHAEGGWMLAGGSGPPSRARYANGLPGEAPHRTAGIPERIHPTPRPASRLCSSPLRTEPRTNSSARLRASSRSPDEPIDGNVLLQKMRAAGPARPHGARADGRRILGGGLTSQGFCRACYHSSRK